MFIEVNKIPPEGLEIDRVLQLQPLQLGSGEQAKVGDTRLSGTLRRSGSDLEFRGRVEAGVSLTCSRCLEPFRQPIEGPCHRIFRAGPLGKPEPEHALVEEDLALTPFDGTRINLEEIAREQVYLAVPLKPLCQESCRGICPKCGAELNTAPCDCPEASQSTEPLTSKLSL
ncbi:MAG: DUF177 domain-containing protein [Acidobacteria bacterium]|nr:DUF177 domain-containing protein [Acidobacteriota bacterium]